MVRGCVSEARSVVRSVAPGGAYRGWTQINRLLSAGWGLDGAYDRGDTRQGPRSKARKRAKGTGKHLQMAFGRDDPFHMDGLLGLFFHIWIDFTCHVPSRRGVQDYGRDRDDSEKRCLKKEAYTYTFSYIALARLQEVG